MQELKIEQLQAGMLIQHAQKLLVFIAPISRSKFYAYFVCGVPTADFECNKNELLHYAESVIKRIIVEHVDSKRIIVSSLSKNPMGKEQKLIYLDEMLDKEYFKSWFLKNTLFDNSLPICKDYIDFLQESDEIGLISLPYMKRGQIYRTKKGTIFSLYLGDNRFLVIPEKYLEDVKNGNYESFKVYLLQVSDKGYKMYFGNCYLYQTGYSVQDSFLYWISENYKTIGRY